MLDEQRGFLSGRAVSAGKIQCRLAGAFGGASLYQHCVRAILHGLRFGEHGLPLMDRRLE